VLNFQRQLLAKSALENESEAHLQSQKYLTEDDECYSPIKSNIDLENENTDEPYRKYLKIDSNPAGLNIVSPWKPAVVEFEEKYEPNRYSTDSFQFSEPARSDPTENSNAFGEISPRNCMTRSERIFGAF